jgi:hypothetical protein
MAYVTVSSKPDFGNSLMFFFVKVEIKTALGRYEKHCPDTFNHLNLKMKNNCDKCTVILAFTKSLFTLE